MATIKTNPKKFIKALQGSIKSAIPVTLNSFVIKGKKDAPDQIAKDMTLRSRGFISSSIRYQKATRARLMASYGMIPRDRFTGLAEQEKGETKTKRAPTLKGSRGGTLRRRVSPRFRLKPGVEIASHKSFKRKPKSDLEMLAVWRNVGYKGLFYLPKNEGRLKSKRQGIYRFTGKGNRTGNKELVHAIGDIPKQKKRPWMKHTNERILKSNDGRRKWSSTMRKFMSDRLNR